MTARVWRGRAARRKSTCRVDTLRAWQPRGVAPVLFLSARAVYAPGKAIRGGVPLIFPWFGPHATDRQAPMHGFARARPWRLVTATGSARRRHRGPRAGPRRRRGDPAAVAARLPRALRVTVGDTLGMAPSRWSTPAAPFTFEAALHTYLTVSDVQPPGVRGLGGHGLHRQGRRLRAQAPRQPARCASPARPTASSSAPAPAASSTIPGCGRRVAVDKTGSASTVVWNPWAAKCAGIADMAPTTGGA